MCGTFTPLPCTVVTEWSDLHESSEAPGLTLGIGKFLCSKWPKIYRETAELWPGVRSRRVRWAYIYACMRQVQSVGLTRWIVLGANAPMALKSLRGCTPWYALRTKKSYDSKAVQACSTDTPLRRILIRTMTQSNCRWPIDWQTTGIRNDISKARSLDSSRARTRNKCAYAIANYHDITYTYVVHKCMYLYTNYVSKLCVPYIMIGIERIHMSSRAWYHQWQRSLSTSA